MVLDSVDSVICLVLFQLRQKKKTVAKVVVSFSENKELFEILIR